MASTDGAALFFFALDGFSDLLNQVLNKGQEVFQGLKAAFLAQSIDEIRDGQWEHRWSVFRATRVGNKPVEKASELLHCEGLVVFMPLAGHPELSGWTNTLTR